jgi:hypothetical protein
MRTLVNAARLAVLPLALALGMVVATPPPAATAGTVGSAWIEGTLVHISANNIKVKTGTQELSFLLVPHFDQVFSGDGKTTYQMKNLHSGQTVKVFYDQKFFGQRHADRILVLNRAQQPMKQQKG